MVKYKLMRETTSSFFIYTFGCRLNQAESADITRQFLDLGWIKAESFKKAKLVMVNSCTVTAKADSEVRRMLRRIKRENPACFLVLIGCGVEMELAKLGKKYFSFNRARKAAACQYMAGRDAVKEKKEIFSQISPAVDLIVSNKDKCKVKKWLPKDFKNFSLITNSYNPVIDKYHRSGKALIKIQEGCSNFCSYCIVPYVRGKPKSVPADEIVDKIQKEVKEGINEAVLTGVDLGSYRFKIHDLRLKTKSNYKNHLVKLLDLLLRETKVEKISFGSMSLKVFDEEFFELYSMMPGGGYKFFSGQLTRLRQAQAQTANARKKIIPSSRYIGVNLHPSSCFNPRLSTHFHIPLQSGSEAVLKRMRRPYTVKEAVGVLKKIKEKIPQASISTDIIVGFPGETEVEFGESVDFIKQIQKLFGNKFTKIHIFRYSPRPGTLADKMLKLGKWKRVSGEVKRKRAERIRGIQS